MKRVFALILTLILVLSCAGCTPKTAITADEFRTTMEAAGYDVEDITDTYDTDGMEVLILGAEQDDCEIEFFEFEKESDAQGVFAFFRNQTEDLPHNGYASVTMGNFAKYEQTSGSTFYSISIIDNTVLYCVIEQDAKGAVKEIIETLGYN